MNSNLLILGAGGHGQVIKELAMLTGKYDQIDFLDDVRDDVLGICSESIKLKSEYQYAIPAFGNCVLREHWFIKLKEFGFKIPILIHPKAMVSPSANIKEGAVISMGAIVNCGSVIEQGCIIGIGALIDHDSRVCEFSYIQPGEIVLANTAVPPKTKYYLQINRKDISIVDNFKFEIGV